MLFVFMVRWAEAGRGLSDFFWFNFRWFSGVFGLDLDFG